MGYRLGIDSGGTFTDVVLFDEKTGNLKITKTPSTPSDPSVGVYNGIVKIIEQEGLTPEEISALVHGTTVATNALLEYKGVETALLTTKGFKDVLSIVRQDRPMLYDYFITRPAPLVPRSKRFEINERTLFNGEVKTPLDDAEVLKAIDTLKDRGITAVAVCLLHSYANPGHELRVKELFTEHYPQATVSLSSEILPEIREYERMSTTVINSYVMPIIEGYLAVLEGRMKDAGLSVELNVMQSNGGVMPARSAGKKSVATILSGPAGGVLGSQWLVSLAGIKDVITLDIGGTSSDICLISQGSFLSTTESEIGGHAIKVPMIDINTIGAGGGSIAWIDQGGSLRVGPQSAGADPGPACYGKGGTKPTVTDANLVLGRLNPDFYVGGEMSLDTARAEKAVREHVADPLGMTLQQAAEGILQVVNANMIRGIRRVSVERGYDPRQFSLMAFGGGGPLHATQLAAELNIPKVVVPLTPGVNSAVGIIIADFRYDYSKTFLCHSSKTEPSELESAFVELEERAISEMMSDHLGPEKVVFKRSADMRYLGQGYEMEIPLPSGRITQEGLAELSQSFHKHHFKAYGYSQPDEETELVYLRLSAVGQIPKPEFAKYPLAGLDPSKAHKGMRKVHLNGTDIEAALYDRGLLKAGNKVTGPAVIEQFDSTTLLDRNQTAYVDEYLNLIVTIAGEQDK